MKVGRVCVKTMGREKGLLCLIIEELDSSFVMIDGLTRRRKCNKAHLQPTPNALKISNKAKTETVLEAMKQAELITDKEHKARMTSKDKPKGPKPVKKKKLERRARAAKQKENKTKPKKAVKKKEVKKKAVTKKKTAPKKKVEKKKPVKKPAKTKKK